jgi:small subunit ribosomal protein S20
VANHPSAVKRNRQNIKRRSRNSARRHQVRTAERKLRKTLEGKDQKVIKTTLSATVAEIMLAKSKGLIPANRASRKVARLSRAAHKATTKKA